MPIYKCKCKNCSAEFYAALDNADEVFKCPSCEKEEIERTETDIPTTGCGGSCGGCSGSCN